MKCRTFQELELNDIHNNWVSCLDLGREAWYLIASGLCVSSFGSGTANSAIWRAGKHHLRQCFAASSDFTKNLDSDSAQFGESDTAIYMSIIALEQWLIFLFLQTCKYHMESRHKVSLKERMSLTNILNNLFSQTISCKGNNPSGNFCHVRIFWLSITLNCCYYF